MQGKGWTPHWMCWWRNLIATMAGKFERNTAKTQLVSKQYLHGAKESKDWNNPTGKAQARMEWKSTSGQTWHNVCHSAVSEESWAAVGWWKKEKVVETTGWQLWVTEEGMEERKETVLCAKHFAVSLFTGTEWVKSPKRWQKSMLCKAMKKCQKLNKAWF